MGLTECRLIKFSLWPEVPFVNQPEWEVKMSKIRMITLSESSGGLVLRIMLGFIIIVANPAL